jgi:hypothetical protein
VQPAQAAGVEPGGAGALGLHRGADPLQRADDPLPGVGHPGRVGRHEPQRRTAGERLAEPQAGVHAVRLGGGGRLADQLLAPQLGRERERPGGKGLAAAGGHRELEAREEDADDHARTHVRIPGGRVQQASGGGQWDARDRRGRAERAVGVAIRRDPGGRMIDPRP